MKNKVLRLDKNVYIGIFGFKHIKYFKLQIGRLSIFFARLLSGKLFEVEVMSLDDWFVSYSINLCKINIECRLFDCEYYQKNLIR